ncbi:MAG: helix-turn-helix transcriptional regulator [Pseudomonadota bacterium]
MNRAINGPLMKRLRQEAGWSQEELAIAAGLSTRTVQRLESEGSGSTQSIKSVAAALEISMHNLEQKPRTALAGMRWGFGGVAVGTLSATVAILSSWSQGSTSAYDAGLAFAIVGAFAGVASAFIGWASSRY